MPPKILAALVVALAALVFLAMLGRKDIVTSHEARVAQTAREMAAAGWPWTTRAVEVPRPELVEVDGMLRLAPAPNRSVVRVNPWLVPVMNRQVRLQKPPLPYWCSAVMFRLFGVSEAWARFPAAVLGFLSTFLVMDLARRVLGRSAGVYAGLIWVSSYFIIDEHRKAMADPYLAFATLTCIWAWVRASTSPSEGRLRWDILEFYIALGFGLLAKGPVMLVHVALASIAYTICNQWRWPRGWGSHLAGILILFAIALPWPIYVLTGVPHAVELWRYESVGELTDNMEKARSWHFYFPTIGQTAFPWTPITIIGAIAAIRRAAGRRSRRRQLFPVIWYVATIAFFSLLHVKKLAYLLPVMPAVVLMTTQGVIAVVRWLRERRRSRAGASPLRGGEVRVWMAGAATAVALTIALVSSLLLAARENARSPRAVCRQLLSQYDPHQIVVCGNQLPEEASFYLPLNINTDPNAPKSLVILDDRYGKTDATPATLASRFPGRTIVSVSRLSFERTPDRWKVYEVTSTQ
jgi:4-amino-4-deoxy-L-arabinose transferase-like glycosyltransferase